MQRCVVFARRNLPTFGGTCSAYRATSTKPTESRILRKLKEALNPQELLVQNESHMHNVPKGSETHFRVTVVSSVFEGKSLVQQHAMVYAALKEELKNPVHALSVEAMVKMYRDHRLTDVAKLRRRTSGNPRPENRRLALEE